MNDKLSSLMNNTNLVFILTIIILSICIISLIISIILFFINRKKKTSQKSSITFLIISGISLLLGVIFSLLTTYFIIQSSKEYKYSLASEKESYSKVDINNEIYYEIQDFKFIDDEGKEFSKKSLSNYKYTIINLWEPWCSPCKEEMPDINKIYMEFKDKGINIVGIYCERENSESVRKEFSLVYPTVYVDKTNYDIIFGPFISGSLPTTFVLDSNGKLINIESPKSSYSMYIGENPSEETIELYKSLVIGKRDYDFWIDLINNKLLIQ